jgi:CheY-like chemotaxis protein
MKIRYSILLVSGSEDDAVLMRHIFSGSNMVTSVFRAHPIEMAVEYLRGIGRYRDRNRYPRPQVIILDAASSLAAECNFLKWVRSDQNLNAISVIVLSASSAEAEIERAYRSGANAFLVRPPTLIELTALLENVRRFWLEINVDAPVSQAEEI